MANVKITELTALTNPASSDVLPIEDLGADETKKVTIADLLENAGDGSTANPAFSFDNDKNTGIYRPGADQLAISIGGSEAARFDGDGRLLIGTTNATDNIRTHHKLAIVYAGNNTYTGAGFTGYSGTSAAAAPFLEIQRSRGTTDGDLTRVNNGDRLGSLNFRGADGTNFITAANIACEVDGTPGTNDMPGRLVFAVTADGASSPTERARITKDGNFHIGGVLPSSPNISLNENGTATFSARVTSNRSTDGYAFEADYNSSLRGGIYASSTGASLVLKDSSGTTNISLDGSNGAATFGGDIETTTAGDGVILKSPNGTRYRLTVANDGTLSTSAV